MREHKRLMSTPLTIRDNMRYKIVSEKLALLSPSTSITEII